MRPSRRRVLAGTGSVLASSIAGCLDNFNSSSDPFDGTITEVSAYHPIEQPTFQVLHASSTDPTDFSVEAKTLGDLPQEVKHEALISITRGIFVGVRKNLIQIDDPLVVEYGSEYFHLNTSFRGFGTERNDEDILSLDATLAGNEITITVTNEAQQYAEITTWGAPPFGPLFAWDGDPHFLEHDQYNQNGFIITDDDKLYQGSSGSTRENITKPSVFLEVGESLDTTYTIPGTIDGEASIYLDLFSVNPVTTTVWNVAITE
jgi:hypothetical protein